jgi:fumarate reductase subunit C
MDPATMILPASAQRPLTQVKSQSGTNLPSSNVSMATRIRDAGIDAGQRGFVARRYILSPADRTVGGYVCGHCHAGNVRLAFRTVRKERIYMVSSNSVIAGVGLGGTSRKSRWPARLDLVQSGTGLVLALFMWGHMFFVSTILISNDAMWTVTKFFEGYFVFGRSYPMIVSFVVAGVIALIVVHAFLAVRKFPINYRQFTLFRGHMKMMRHEDTTLWFWQVLTGFALFFFAAPHVYIMLTHPELIGPFESGDRVWTGHYWPLYILLLLAVELHGGIGLYRLAVKWGWFAGSDPNTTRRRLKTLKWALTVFFLVLGFATLAAYVKIGIAHAPDYGQPYVPGAQQGIPPAVRP